MGLFPQVLRWNFTAPRLEFVDQLKAQMETAVGGSLMEKLYNKDFKKHIQGIEVLIKVNVSQTSSVIFTPFMS